MVTTAQDSSHSELDSESNLKFTTVALAQFDTKTRFELKVAKGDVKIGLKLLDKLDKELI